MTHHYTIAVGPVEGGWSVACDAMLRERSFDERRNVGRRISDGAKSVRHPQALHEPRNAIGQNHARV